MVLPPKVAPFASSNRSFVRESKARELVAKTSNRSSLHGFGAPNQALAAAAATKARRVKDVPLPPSLDRSFVKQSRLKPRQAESSNLSFQEERTSSSTIVHHHDVVKNNTTEKATSSAIAPTSSSSMMSAQDSIYRDLLLASEDRSFVKQEEAPLPNSSSNKIKRLPHQQKANLSFQGLPTTSTQLTTDNNKNDDVSLTHSLPPLAAANTTTTKMTNTSTSSINHHGGNHHDRSLGSTATSAAAMTPPISIGKQSYYASSSSAAARGSSFWAEWAASEDVEHVVAMLNMTVDPSLDVTTASAAVESSTAKNNNSNKNTTTGSAATKTSMNLPKEEIDAVADVLLLGTSREEVYHDDEDDTGAAEHERSVLVNHNYNNDNNNNTSINTFAALNITHATVNVSALAATAVDETAASELSVCGQAMEDSSAATQLLVEKKYWAALDKFEQAVHGYESIGDASLVATVNRAGCHRNMATASRALERYDETGRQLQLAQDLYLHCRDQLERKNERAVLTLDGQLLENSKVAGDVSTVSQAADEYMCLDEMILETLQSRATFYVKYQDDIEQAVECHEQALKRLLQINRFKHWEAMSEYLVLHEGITFTPLPKDRHTLLLTRSLEALGKLYRALEPGANSDDSTPACLVVYEDALDVLQSRMEQDDPENDAMIHSVAKILRCLSEVYFQRKELDRAVDALHDSTAVKLRASGEPCAESLAVMDKMGAANEKMRNWAKALLCYEQTLLARSKFYGNTHIQVATSLVNVARVMELKDGMSEESLDLFRAANAIFALQTEEDEAELERLSTKEEAETILQGIPSELRQGHYEKAVEQLNKCLAFSDDSNRNVSLDRAQIFFDLGRAYLNMNDFQKASECLVEAVREAGSGMGDEYVAAMMQNFGFFLRPGGATTGAKDNEEEDDDDAAAEAEDAFDDPPLSLMSINLDMEKEDEEEEERILERSYRDRMTKIEMLDTSTNPHHQILYESFVQEEGPRSPQFQSAKNTGPFRGTVRRTLRERVWTEKNRQLPAKIAKKLSDKVKALQKKKLPKKLKKLGTKYWKRAFDRKSTTTLPNPFRCIVNTEASLMVIEEEEHRYDQQPSKTNEDGGAFKVVGVAPPRQPAARRLRSVLIEEEMNGFSVQAQ